MPNYIVRVFKSWGARDADRRWANTYEIDSPAASPAGLTATVNAIVAAEKLIHSNNVHFLSATVSTWTPDSVPYNPLTFTTVDLSGQGNVADTANYSWLDSNVCLVAKFTPELGRSGRRFYRGCLNEAMVEIGGDGKFTVSPAGTMVFSGSIWTSFQTAMSPLLAGGASADTIMLIGEANGGILGREVAVIKQGGVAVNKRNHRYFDRT